MENIERAVETNNYAKSLIYRKLGEVVFIPTNCLTRFLPMVKGNILRVKAQRSWTKRSEKTNESLPPFTRETEKCEEHVGISYDIRRIKERTPFPTDEIIEYIAQGGHSEMTTQEATIEGKSEELGEFLNESTHTRRYHADTKYAATFKNTSLVRAFCEPEVRKTRDAIAGQHLKESSQYHMATGLLDLIDLKTSADWYKNRGDKLPVQYIEEYSSDGKKEINGDRELVKRIAPFLDASKFKQAQPYGNQLEAPPKIAPLQSRLACWRPKYGWQTIASEEYCYS